MAKSTIHAGVDFERDGKQIDYLYLPHSPHSDAWGTVNIPIAVIKHGGGPTVLMMGGNHGDEYEGPITLAKLIRELEPEQIQGRLIILPALNTPAVLAGNRVSPLDGKNMNRSFPGSATGTVTEQIAFYVTEILFPLVDVVMDLHSGGSSLEMVPSALIEPASDPELAHRIKDFVLAFDAPLTIIHGVPGESRTSNFNSIHLGKIMIGTELGGSGAVSIGGLAVTERGIFNVLNKLGMVESQFLKPPLEKRTRLIEAMGLEAHVYVSAAGVFEPCHELGATVQAGEICGYTHFLDDPARSPEPAHFKASGIMFSRRAPGQVVRGSCVAVVGAPED
ncbi:MAG: succinylglutamate desuccinylase/aspartoacylase family protein [Pseudomonadota bacterium]